MGSKAPIGFFDSGIGGTSIWREVHQLLPKENTLYLADSRNAPYGARPKEEIIGLSKKNTEFLLEQGCKCIVVACNTATTNAISLLRREYDAPFVGIEPAIKPAALTSSNGRVGVLATKGTLSSELFAQTSQAHTSGVEVIEVEGTGLVPLIESGQLHSPKMTELLTEYTDRFKAAEVDHVVLGCSHYPYLTPQLQTLLGSQINIIDSGEAVARRVREILSRADLLNTSDKSPELRFLTNGDLPVIEGILADIMDPIEIEAAEF